MEPLIKTPLKNVHAWGEVAGGLGTMSGALNGVVVAAMVQLIMMVALPGSVLQFVPNLLVLVVIGLWLSGLMRVSKNAANTGAEHWLTLAALPLIVVLLLTVGQMYLLVVLRGQMGGDELSTAATKTLSRMNWIAVGMALMQMGAVVLSSLGAEQLLGHLDLAEPVAACKRTRLLAAANLAQFGLPWLFPKIANANSLREALGSLISILTITVAVIMAGLYAFMKLASAARAGATQIELKLLAQETEAHHKRAASEPGVGGGAWS